MNEIQTGPAVAGSLDRRMDPPRRCQARALRFKMLATLWIFPSLGALWIIVSDGARWFRAATVPEGIQVVTFEQWAALAVLLLHALFLWLAGHYRRTEIPRELPPDDVAVESGDVPAPN